MEAGANPRVVGSLRSFARIAGAAVVLVGFVVLTGWVLNVPTLKGIYPGLGTMKVNTALCFLLAGIALWLLCSPQRSHRTRSIINVCAGIVAILGLLMLLDYFFEWNLGLDTMLLRQSVEAFDPTRELRTAPSTSLNLLLVGSALLWIDVEAPRGFWFSQFFALIAILVSLLAFIGYIYGVNSFYGFGADTYVSLHSAVTFFLLCVGILAARPDRGLMSIVTDDGVGGILARRLLPAAVALPLILGGFALAGERLGYYDTDFRLSLLVASSILVFAVLIWWDAGSLKRIDVERRRAETSLRRYTERLQNLVEVGRAILASHSQQEIAASTLPRIRRQLMCDLALVSLFDFEAGEAVLLAVDAANAKDFAASKGTADSKDTSVQAGQEIHLLLERVGFGDIEVLLRGGLHIVRDIREYSVPAVPRRSIEPRKDLKTLVQWLETAGTRSYTNIPLLSHSEVMGCLTLAWSAPTNLDVDSLNMAREVADRLATGLQQIRLFEQVRSGREQLKTLSHRLIQAQEVERRNLAHELHDEVGQALTAIKINLQAVQRKPELGVLQTRLEDSISIVENVLRQVRDLSLDLRPSMLDDLGLVAALRWYVDRQAQRAGFEVRLSADTIEPRLPPDIETACFRVTQEALTNIVRHARATRVEIRLRIGDVTTLWEPPATQELQLMIRDNGVGFDVTRAHSRATSGSSLGLLGMEERVLLVGGKIDVESTPVPVSDSETTSDEAKRSSGTEVRAYFPLALTQPLKDTSYNKAPVEESQEFLKLTS